jgi:hypothetical protein
MICGGKTSDAIAVNKIVHDECAAAFNTADHYIILKNLKF